MRFSGESSYELVNTVRFLCEELLRVGGQDRCTTREYVFYGIRLDGSECGQKRVA